MSLLVLKTKDLTWQDHTLNIEAMLAPTRSQLLVNKHKSYDARATTDKDLYDKQKVTRLKDYVIEKRMMERRRERINKRKRDILMERARSADARVKSNEDVDVELQSNASDTKLLRKRPPTQKSCRKTLSPQKASPSLPPTGKASSLQALNTKDIDITCQDFENGVFVTELIKKEDKLPNVFDTNQRSASLSRLNCGRGTSCTTDSLSRQHEHVKSRLFDRNGNPKPLSDKVKEFLQEQRDFNADPQLRDSKYTWNLIERRAKLQKKPPLINKQSSLTLDKGQLESAFDEFCSDNSKEGFQKMVKVAAKLKAKVAVARNQSWIPALATIKFTKRLLEKRKQAAAKTNPQITVESVA